MSERLALLFQLAVGAALTTAGAVFWLLHDAWFFDDQLIGVSPLLFGYIILNYRLLGDAVRNADSAFSFVLENVLNVRMAVFAAAVLLAAIFLCLFSEVGALRAFSFSAVVILIGTALLAAARIWLFRTIRKNR